MITFEDFAPRITGAGGLLRRGRFESFEDAVRAADTWVKENGVQLISIETVVLPNVWDPSEEGTVDAELATEEGQYGRNHWYQFVRVWYHRPE